MPPLDAPCHLDAAPAMNPPGCMKVAAVAVLALALLAPSVLAGQGPLPRRVISLAPSITREMYDLGAQDLLVGATSYCPLPEGSPVQIVGNPGRISIEKACSLRPDIVLASTDCSSKADVAAMKRLGFTTHVFAGCESFECMCETFLELGSLLGKRGRAESMVRDIRSRIAAIQAGVRGKNRPRVFWQVGSTPLVTASDATFAGEFLRRAGAVNVFGDAPMHYPRVNAEEVLMRNPDVIIVVREMDPGTLRSTWERYKHMAAVKNGRIHELSADLVCQPTPAMFLKGLEAVVAALHPEAP